MTLPNTPSVISPVLINGQELNVAVIRALVTRKESEHDSAILFVNSATATIDYTTLPDSRIEFPFGNVGLQSTFQGYVNSVTPNRRYVAGTVNTEQEIDCLGATMVMKGNKPRFFTDLTATQMMSQIVSEAGLGFNDEYRNDNDKWRQLAQTNESDWQMVLNLADRVGAHVVYEKGVVRLINYLDISYRQLPDRLYTSQTSVSAGDRTTDSSGNVIEYVPINAGLRDPSYLSPTMSYLANRRAVIVPPPDNSAVSSVSAGASASQGSLLVSRFATDYPANSQPEAAAIQGGFYQPPWNQSGSLRVTGDALMMPGLVIQVSSARKGLTMQADYDGVWYVQGVDHSIGQQGRFFTTLTMSRTEARGSNWYPSRPFWLGDKRGNPVLRASGQGQWLSTWRLL